jgi:hypothetical protein
MPLQAIPEARETLLHKRTRALVTLENLRLSMFDAGDFDEYSRPLVTL